MGLDQRKEARLLFVSNAHVLVFRLRRPKITLLPPDSAPQPWLLEPVFCLRDRPRSGSHPAGRRAM
jgi:hypothetical protein